MTQDLGALSGSREPSPSCTGGLGPLGFDPARYLGAFRDEWERLGSPAARLRIFHGNGLISVARKLRDLGLVETRFIGGNWEWRLVDPTERLGA